MRKIKNRALIAGGAGFIGANLCADLLERGFIVDAIDNFITSKPSKVEVFEGHPRYNFIKGDACDAGLIWKLVDRHYTHVFNLASPTGVPNIAKMGEEMLLTAAFGSYHLLHLARTRAAKYLYASTAEIYGDPKVTPQPETYNGNVDPRGPRSAYEEGKRFGEALTMLFVRKYGLDARIIRIFNTYGPGMCTTDTRVIPQLVTKLSEGQSFRIYGDGQQTRSFLYVDDLISGLLCALERGQSGEVYNIGHHEERTILELFEEAREAADVDAMPVFEPHFIPDMSRRCPDTAKIRGLGWRPRVDLQSGLRRSFAAYRDARGSTGMPVAPALELTA